MLQLNNISTTPRSWVQNGYGRCEFSIPLDDPRLKLENFQFGNFIHIEHLPTTSSDEGNSPSGKLPDWTGIILPNRTWSNNAVSITAYSIEALLAFRALPFVDISLPISQAFIKIIEYANNVSASNFIQILIGDIEEKNTSYSDSLRMNAFDHLKKMAELSGTSWDITGKILPESYALQVKANFYNSTFRNSTPSITLTSGENGNTEMTLPLLIEQGTIINDIFAYTQSNTPQDRTFVEIRNNESIDKYGVFQANKIYTGITDISGLNSLVENPNSLFQGVKKLFTRKVIDTGDTFSNLRIGNLISIYEKSVGFDPSGGFGVNALAKIIGMSYNDTSNRVDLTLEVLE